MTLDALFPGQRAIIDSVDEGDLAVRLQEMGLVPGAEVVLVRRAPFGDPIEVEVLGCRLALRAVDAGLVTVRCPA